MTTDASGQVFFSTPFTPPAGLPVITATATASGIGTCELTSFRQGRRRFPRRAIRLGPGQAVSFYLRGGPSMTIRGSLGGALSTHLGHDALGPGERALALTTTAGLIGLGDGTGVLSYSGSVAALRRGI